MVSRCQCLPPEIHARLVIVRAMSMNLRAATIMLAVAVSACGTSDEGLPPSAVCHDTAQCESSLSCLDVATVTSTSCTVVGKSCTITCLDDTGCAELGENFKCFAGCGTEKTCGATASQ